MASALVGGSPRKTSFSKQKVTSVSPLTLQITPNVSADIGGMTLQNGFVSTLTSACQLDERSSTNDVAMYFMGPLCRQSPPDWVREYSDAVPRGAYVQYLRPNAHENTTRLSFELASGETLEADGTWAWHAATNDLVSLRQCYEGLKDMLINKMDFKFPAGRTSLFMLRGYFWRLGTCVQFRVNAACRPCPYTDTFIIAMSTRLIK